MMLAYVPTVPILEGQSLFHKERPSKDLGISIVVPPTNGHKVLFYCNRLGIKYVLADMTNQIPPGQLPL